MQPNPSRQSASSATSWRSTWERLTPTLRSVLRAKPAQFIAYAHLWYLCDGRPQTLTMTAADLGAALGGKDQRTARGWLDALRDAGLVDFADRDRETGVYQLYVHPPEVPGQPRRVDGDPQGEMFVPPDEPADVPIEPPAVIAGVFAQEPPRAKTSAGVSAQKPPRTDPGKSTQRSLWGQDGCDAAKTPAGVSAQKPPPWHGAIDHKAIPTVGIPKTNSSLEEREPAAEPPKQKNGAIEELRKLAAAEAGNVADERVAEVAARIRQYMNQPLFIQVSGQTCSKFWAKKIAKHLLTNGYEIGELTQQMDRLQKQVEDETYADQPPADRIKNPGAVFVSRLNSDLDQMGKPPLPKGKPK